MKHRNLLLIFVSVCFIQKAIAAAKHADTTGTENIAMNHVSYIPFNNSPVYMWPNPARDKINIYINSLKESDQGECIIYNNAGTPVLIHPVNNGSNSIIIATLPSGMYMVRIHDRGKNFIVKKLIVSK